MTNYTKKETDENGDTFYYNDRDQHHRLDGPAVEWADGYNVWCVNDLIHRLDGPAVEHADGYKEWWVDGKQFTEEDWQKHPSVIEYPLLKVINEVLSEKN